MYDIPTSITIDGKDYHIRNDGDYRMVLDCFLALEDAELDNKERLFSSLIIFYEDLNSIEDVLSLDNLTAFVTEMYNFFNCGQKESPGARSNYRLIDWDADAQLICSAVNKVAGKEIRLEKYIHWWTFLGYYGAVGESTLSTVITIRDKITRHKSLEKYEKEFKRNNPQFFNWNSDSLERQEANKLALDLWNSEG